MQLASKMITATSKAYVTRDSILKLLSDDEVARVSTAETAVNLASGDEYIDLERLDKGGKRAAGKADASSPMGHVLPRKAVREATWAAIVALLDAAHR